MAAHISLFLCFIFSETEAQAVDRIAPKYNATAIEYVLPDRTRVDILTPRYAIEVDWSRKWAEAIGQSLYYSIMTKRRAAIILLVKDPFKEARYVKRCMTVARRHGIRVFVERSP